MDVTIWFYANWNTAPKEPAEMEAIWPHWQRVIGLVLEAGVTRIAVNISGGVDRTKALVERFMTQWRSACPTCGQLPTTCSTCGKPGPEWTFGVSTSEVFGSRPLDGDPAHWEPLVELCRWIQGRGARVIVDFEWSLLPWFRGETDDFDVDQFRHNCRTLREVGPVLVYPTQWDGITSQPRRMKFLMAVLRAGVEPTLIGTTWHSPHSLAHPQTPAVRVFEQAACRPRLPAEQIIIGSPHWFLPHQLVEVLRSIPRGAEVLVWWDGAPNFLDPNNALVPATLEAIQSAMSTPTDRGQEFVLTGLPRLSPDGTGLGSTPAEDAR